MKNILLYYSFSFSFGGGEHLPLSLIAALQNSCNLTVALDMADNLERAARVFDIPIDMSRLQVVQVTPPGYAPNKHNAFVSLYRARQLQKLAKNADVCISTANIIDFGKPAHHFINMLAFGDDAFTAYVLNHAVPVREKASARIKRFFLETVVRPILGMRTKKSIICDRREHVYPNSQFVEKLMTDFYGPFNSHVFYPPTLFETKSEDAFLRDPLKIVYIGRIIPEKRITELIEIVEKVRLVTGLPVTFHLAGRLDQTPSYGEKLRKMAKERDWLFFDGALYGEAKERFLLSGTYALHAERDEAFGISVAEYLKSGNIAIVPDEGGACEVVNNSALTYRTNEDAVAILKQLLADERFRNVQKAYCTERAKLFSRKAYFERQNELLQLIVGDGLSEKPLFN